MLKPAVDLTRTRIILLATLFIMSTGNLELFERLLEIYPPTLSNLPFLTSLALFFSFATALFLVLVTPGSAGRWVLASILVLSSQAAYYMDQYGVVIDGVMIDNILATNVQEAKGLMSWSLLLRTFFLGLLPAWLIVRHWPTTVPIAGEVKTRSLMAIVLITLIIAVVAPFTAGYASFIRQHKITRMYANPTFFTFSTFNFIARKFKQPGSGKLKRIVKDARKTGPAEKNELIILVVGETARADRFSLNGYQRQTNPLLEKEEVLSLTDVSSCGTSTGESVPCMFSGMTRKNFDREEALHIENVLDILFEQGVRVLWRDNNSDSKGVAVRVQHEDFKSPATNPACDSECRDIGMLSGLDTVIRSNKGRDMLIVLHQMGNHGPEYYRRYPKAFERYTPVCKSSELRDCSKEEIDNAYDNAILYTDFFLSETIRFLKKYDGEYETAMLYVSDHGESLGEHGIYLHALPYIVAPKEQTHVPAVVWMGKHFDLTLEQLKPYRDYPLSHDDLFCTLLAGFEIQTGACVSRKEWLEHNLERKPRHD